MRAFYFKGGPLPEKFLKFAGVGGAATAVHSSCYLTLVAVFNVEGQLSNFLGFLLALSVSYIGHRYWTFSNEKIRSELRTKFKFSASSLLSLGLNALWVYLTVECFSLSSEYSVIGIIFVTPLIVFLVLKKWVFV